MTLLKVSKYMVTLSLTAQDTLIAELNHLMKETVIFSRDEATLYERVSVRWSVGWLVGPSVRNAFVKFDEKWPFMDSK